MDLPDVPEERAKHPTTKNYSRQLTPFLQGHPVERIVLIYTTQISHRLFKTSLCTNPYLTNHEGFCEGVVNTLDLVFIENFSDKTLN